MQKQIVLNVSEELMALIRNKAKEDEELEDMTDDELLEWVGDSLQTDIDNGDLINDTFNY